MRVANRPPFFWVTAGSGGWGQSPIVKWPHTAKPQAAGRGRRPQPRPHKHLKNRKRKISIKHKKKSSVKTINAKNKYGQNLFQIDARKMCFLVNCAEADKNGPNLFWGGQRLRAFLLGADCLQDAAGGGAPLAL